MKNRQKIRTKLLAWFGILVMVLTVMTPTTVYAGATWDGLSKAERKTAQKMFTILTSKYGLTREAALGLVANADRESQFDIRSRFSQCFSEEDANVGGVGLFQWDDRKSKLFKYCGSAKELNALSDDACIAKQIEYAMSDDEISQKWKDYGIDGGKGGAMSSSHHLKRATKNGKAGWNQVKKWTDGKAVANAWLNAWERSADRNGDATSNEKYYDSLAKHITGTGSTEGGTTVSATDFTLIGDSRMIGMISSNSIKAGTDFGEVIAHVGSGRSMLKKLVAGELSDCNGCGGNPGTSNHSDGGTYKISKDYVVIWMGINDLGGLKSIGSETAKASAINAAAKDYQDCIKKLIADGKKVLWVACGVVYSKGSAVTMTNSNIKAFNSKMSKFCKETSGVDYVKINKGKVAEVKSDKNYSSDGIHYTEQPYKDAWSYISDAINTLAASESSSGDSSDASGSVTNAAIKTTGIMNESEFLSGKYLDIKESVVALPDTTMLTVNEQKQIAQWGNNIDYMSNTWVDYLRSSVSFLGIMITIYCMLLYVIYWFDRVNTVIDFPILPIVTLGVLEVSPDDKLNTYSANSGSSRKIVTHQNMVAIVFSGVLLGVLLISGIIYKIVALLLQLIDYLKGIIFG